MILAIDIGNTNIVIGGFEGESLNFVARLSTDPRKTDSEYAATIKSVIALVFVCAGIYIVNREKKTGEKR